MHSVYERCVWNLNFHCCFSSHKEYCGVLTGGDRHRAADAAIWKSVPDPDLSPFLQIWVWAQRKRTLTQWQSRLWTLWRWRRTLTGTSSSTALSMVGECRPQSASLGWLVPHLCPPCDPGRLSSQEGEKGWSLNCPSVLIHGFYFYILKCSFISLNLP